MTYRELVPIVEEHNAGHVIGFIIGKLLYKLNRSIIHVCICLLYIQKILI